MTLRVIEQNYDTIKAYKKKFYGKLAEETRRDRLKICLFGCGGYGISVQYQLVDLGLKIHYFCDNNPLKHGKTLVEGIECISPQALAEKAEAENILVCVSVSATEEVYALPGVKSRCTIRMDRIKHPLFDIRS